MNVPAVIDFKGRRLSGPLELAKVNLSSIRKGIGHTISELGGARNRTKAYTNTKDFKEIGHIHYR